MKTRMKKMDFGIMGPLQGPKMAIWAIEGSHLAKVPNIPIVAYQIKGFGSLVKTKMKKMVFLILGPLQVSKMAISAIVGSHFNSHQTYLL